MAGDGTANADERRDVARDRHRLVQRRGHVQIRDIAHEGTSQWVTVQALRQRVTLQNSLPSWEDLIQRGIKFQRQLEYVVRQSICCKPAVTFLRVCRATIVAYNYFAEGFGKVADTAVRSKGTRAHVTSIISYVQFL